MDSDKKMEEIELLEKALIDCRAFKKWIAGTLSKVEKLNGNANAGKEAQSIIQKKNSNKSKKKKSKKVKSQLSLHSSGNNIQNVKPVELESKLSNISTHDSKDVTGMDLDYGTPLVSARNSHQCLSDYAKINKRYIEVKRSLESLMIDMKRVDDKLKHPKDDFLLSNSIEKPSGCCCHHH